MKNIEEFVEFSVKIEMQENGEFGYFPFHAFVEKSDGTYDVICIAGVDGVEDCYKIMTKYIANNAKRVYMAIDFPAGGDIKNDFVVVFETKGDELKTFAIPYDTKNGTVYPRIKNSSIVFEIVKHFRHFAVEFWMKHQNKNN